MEEIINQIVDNNIEKRNKKVAKLNLIFKRIASIASIIAFALAILFTFGKFVTYYDDNFLSGTIYEYLISNLFSINQNDFSSSTNIILFSQNIFLALLVSANLVITLIFAIKGIKQSIRDIKNNELNSQKHLIFVLLANTCTVHLLLSIKITSSIYVLYNLYLFYLFILLSYEIFIAIFFSFRKNQGLQFTHKIIYSLLIIAIIFLIKALNWPILLGSNTPISVEYLETILLNDILSSSQGDYKIVLFVMNTSLLSFRLLKYAACFVIALFYVKSMFKEEKFSLIMTNYVLSLFIFIITLIELIIILASNTIYKVNAGASNIAISTYPFINLFIGAHIFAIAITSLVMARKIKNEKRRIQAS